MISRTNTEFFFELIKNLIDDVIIQNVNLISNFLKRQQSQTSLFDINAVNNCGHTALSLCLTLSERHAEDRAEVEYVKSAVVNLLLINGASVHIQIRNQFGFVNSMLHIACDNCCQLNVVQLLLQNGLNANDNNQHQQTPLHFAAFHENVDLMSLLIDYGANPIARDKDGDTPIVLLMTAFSHTIYNVNEVPRFLRIDHCLDLLLHNRACLNDIGSDGKSCLFKVINGLHVELALKEQFITKLLDAGANVNIGFGEARNVGFGLFTNRIRSCTYAYREQFDEITYVFGDTPLHAAATLGDLKTVKLLLNYNPDINRTNIFNQTALDYAVMKQRHEIRDEIMFHKRKTLFDFYLCNI
jgi:ankyrin repeat protein